MAEAAQASRTFRVFVSSTFEDMAAERNALQEHVFPMLAAYCAERKARFQAIDLRWGISQEAGLDQRAMAVCLTEIERCQALKLKPNFIVLLGDRYGWRPLPSQIDAEEFKQILEKVPKEDVGLLEWTDKQPAGAKGWHRLDENAADSEYVLRPRKVDVPKGATSKQLKDARDAEKNEWNNVIEPKVRAILLQAIGSLGWSADDPRMDKYVESATEQEIVRGALKPDDAAEHVFGFFRSITDLPADDPSAGFRDTVKTKKGTVLDTEAQERLHALKTKKLKDKLDPPEAEAERGSHVLKYEAIWSSAGVSQDHIGTLPSDLNACEALLKVDTAPHTLCVDVWRSIGRMIDSQLEELEAEESGDLEIKAHVEFGEKRREHFVGREKIRDEIETYVKGSELQPLVVVGEGGSGKSALMAKALEEAEGALAGGVEVVRFIGATPAASEGRSLLDSLCHQIAHEYGADESAIPAEYNDLAVEFGKQLGQATEAKPLIVFLDALDQLGPTDPARSLSWLPVQLPEHVRLVVSTIPDDCEKTLRAKHPEPVFLTLEKMSRKEGKIALDIWLANAGRCLQDDQEKEVLDKFEPEGRPLYLKLAFEEARLWPSYAGKSETKLHAGIPELIKGDLFARLAAPENHGPVMVAHALGYLAASRHGLAEDELIEVLSADKKVRTDFERRSFHTLVSDQLPVVVWSRLYFNLAPYLAEHAADGTTLLAFYHRVLGKSAKEEYLDGHAGKDGKERHSSLADYFRAKADPKDPKTDPKAHEPWNGKSVRGLSELPFHLAGAGRLDDLYETLTDFNFLEHKAAEVAVAEHTGADGETTKTYAGVFQLQDDYELALAKLGGGSAAARKPLIVTGVDFGDGMVIRCPWCNTSSPFRDEYRGRDIECPNEKCKGPLRVNKFVAGESMLETG